MNDVLCNRAAVFICHGVGEHCQAYSKLAYKLNDCDMLVFGHDHGEFIPANELIKEHAFEVRIRVKCRPMLFVLYIPFVRRSTAYLSHLCVVYNN